LCYTADSMINDFRSDHAFLSNFYAHGGQLTAEHIYQAMKTENIGDQIAILSAKTPGQAKRLGQKVTLRKDWEEIKLLVMEAILVMKFTPGTMEHDLLLATGDEELVEGNTWGDTFWGVCRGKGENHLGKLLMKIRDDL
jgi:ribA/ribD-fused uncharacterized protein